MARLPSFVFFLFVGWFCTICQGSAFALTFRVGIDSVPGLYHEDPAMNAAKPDSVLLPSFLPDTVWVGKQETDFAFILAEDSLRVMARDVVHPTEDSLRLVNNDRFMSALKEVLSREGSMAYAFDSLSIVSFLAPPDNSFRIITWYVPLSQQRFSYFGLVQRNVAPEVVSMPPTGENDTEQVSRMSVRPGADPSHEKKRIYELKEATDFHVDADTTVFTRDTWHGIWYYDLITKQHGDEVSYVLLGWRADRPNTRKRIIEPLSFRNGEPLFGAPVFDLPEEQRGQAGQATPARPGSTPLRSGSPGETRQLEPLSRVKEPARIVFEYSVRVTMGLLYDNQAPRPGAPAEPMIVFDRLEPIDEEHRGERAFYVPEGNIFDAFLFREGRWLLVRDVDARGRE